MAVFRAYFDASGNKREQRILTVAGFVGRVTKWEKFEKEWAAILAKEKVRSMHMTDFASSQGEFKNWKGQTDRRRNFISELGECIKRNTNKGFASSVILNDYDDVNAKFRLAEFAGQPFTLCMRACLGGLARWAKKKRINIGELLIAVERGDLDQGELIRIAQRDGFKITALPKDAAKAFEAGDIAAWKTRTVIHNAHYGPLESIEDATKILLSLAPLKAIIKKSVVYNLTAFRRICERGGIPRRICEQSWQAG